LIESFGVADVARANDPFTALQGSMGFGAEQAMGIGNHSNFHAKHQIRFKKQSPV
jgi:hypothetical protein